MNLPEVSGAVCARRPALAVLPLRSTRATWSRRGIGILLLVTQLLAAFCCAAGCQPASPTPAPPVANQSMSLIQIGSADVPVPHYRGRTETE
jgi:hypothetical protein